MHGAVVFSKINSLNTNAKIFSATCSTLRRVAEGGVKHAASNLKNQQMFKTGSGSVQHLHATINKNKKLKICNTSHHLKHASKTTKKKSRAAVVFLNANNLNSRSNIFSATKYFDPPKEI